MWHTKLPSKTNFPIRRILTFIALTLTLFVSGVYSCGGSGGPGGGSPGGGVGGAGAPPVSIPGPEALNMTGITISPPDNSGTVTVSGTPGSAIGNAEVRVRNIGPQISWYQKVVVNSAYAAVGDEVIVKANPDGSFLARIKALIGDRLAIAQRVALKPVFSVEIMGTVQNVPSQPTGLVPANEQRPFLKSNMKVGPGGDTWFIQSKASQKWNWLDLFVSTAHADDLSIQNVAEVICPQVGPCFTRPSVAAHEGYCPLSRVDRDGLETNLQVPYCKDLNAIEPAQIKGPPEQNFLAIAAGKNGIILKENTPGQWVVADVLRFNAPVKGVQSDVQFNDLVFYFSAPQGFYSYHQNTRALAFYPTKSGLNGPLPTSFAKRGSHIFYAIWKDNRASFFQGNIVEEPNFNFQREIPLNVNHPITDMIVLQADTAKKITLLGGDIDYLANEIVFIAGRTMYFVEIPTNASYNSLYAALPANPDLDISKLEKNISIDFSEAPADLSQIANNSDQTIVAALAGEKVYFADYTFGERIPLQAMKVNKVVDVNGIGLGASLAYNPVSKNFILRGLTENVSLGNGQAANASSRSMVIPVSDRNLPEASMRMSPRERAGSREGLEIQVRPMPVRSGSVTPMSGTTRPSTTPLR